MSTSKALPADNKMGTMGVNKLLITMALPMIISMLIQALYNIVDSYFVNLLSQEAFDAVSLAFPIQHLIIGVATGTAVGVNSLLSRSLGEGNREKANRIA
ncbi:MAG: MATE family efflux transporter, partial [Clostridia bacterium]|nr:MATE family efflux transporter [Clostridia bacterium]